MELSNRIANEPFIRVHLDHFSVGKQIQPLENIRLSVDTADPPQFLLNRPKFTPYNDRANGLYFTTSTKQGYQITITIYIDDDKTNYIYQTKIEDLIRHVDKIIREYRFTDGGHAWMSIELTSKLKIIKIIEKKKRFDFIVSTKDLKPENILLMQNGRIKLTDFSLSKQLIYRTETTRTFCGTAAYIAPEIYQNINYSFPIDYWSLSITIYEMILFDTLFNGVDELEIKENVIYRDFQYPNTISSDLQTILTGLLNKNPIERFGINELRTRNFYSSPYSLEDIEQERLPCPWNKPIPSNPLLKKRLATEEICLSYIDKEAICTTLTINNDKFRNFSFIDPSLKL
ncbi:unnamed protein product [Rotaria sp. Silwood1]|nr:unnamed protein product [Rotaria sp. Silwood1]CAF0752579.1 unnamed protein product [Rotaria sp. Silwood1]CAF3330371.1 unnamed protein product [Rotaria sp. Silwood1]CAF3349505.1 unnamed protein product [Rotaria sp. Silwood1]CAF4512060.1 unnamed protein product [Rotaria sp. Silwood1]